MDRAFKCPLLQGTGICSLNHEKILAFCRYSVTLYQSLAFKHNLLVTLFLFFFCIHLYLGSQVTQQASFLQSSSAFHFSQYHATEYRATGCHATGCHGSGCHATDYHSTVTENNINEPGGVAYDHGEFPKIVSVHSMAEGQNNVLQEPTEYHGNDGDDKTQSNCVFPESPLTKTAIGYDATDSKKTSDHSISTILDLPSSVKNCPGQNVSLVKPLAEDDSPRNDAKTNLNSEDHERGMAKGCSSSEDKEIKVRFRN